MLSIKEVPSDDILQSLYKMRMRESDQLTTVLAKIRTRNNPNLMQPNHQKLKMVKRCTDQKIRARNF